MPAARRDLSYEDCERWMRDLGYVSDGKPDWEQLLRDANVGTDKDNLKKRWIEGKAPFVRKKVQEALERSERKRRERTAAGAQFLGLDEWNRLGRIIARRPETFAAQLERLRTIAEGIEQIEEADRLRAKGEATLLSVTPEPTKPRK